MDDWIILRRLSLFILHLTYSEYSFTISGDEIIESFLTS